MAPITMPTGRQALQCVSVALNLVPNSYLDAIINSITLAITTLEGLMALLEAQILALFGIMTALQAQKAAVLSVITALQSQLNIIDMSITQQCPVLGQVNQAAAEATRNFTAPLITIINQIDCYNRIYLEYQQRKGIIQAQIDMLKQVRTAVQSVLNLRSAAIIAANTAAGAL